MDKNTFDTIFSECSFSQLHQKNIQEVQNKLSQNKPEDHPKILTSFNNFLIKNDLYPESRQLCIFLLKNHYDSFYCFECIARLQQSKKNWKKASYSWKKIISKYTDIPPYVYTNLGQCYQNLKLFNNALSAFNTAVELYPKSHFGYEFIARFNQMHNNWTKAIFWWKATIERLPNALYPLVQLSSCYQKSGQFVQAENKLKDVTKRFPNHEQGYIGLARLYQDQRLWEKAISQWKFIINTFSERFYAYDNLATCYLNLNETQKANELYDILLNKFPNHYHGYEGKAKVAELTDEWLTASHFWTEIFHRKLQHQSHHFHKKNAEVILNLHPDQRVFFFIGLLTSDAIINIFKQNFSHSYALIFVPPNRFEALKKYMIDYKENAEFVIWSVKGHAPHFSPILNFLKKHNINLSYMEDGFINSVNSRVNSKFSLTTDYLTCHFDSTKPSHLEIMLNNYEKQPHLISWAKKCKELMIRHKISKYNHLEHKQAIDIYGPKKQKRILVIGQIESDLSIRYGLRKSISNNQLVRIAREENPEAQIFYKIHPDIHMNIRAHDSNPEEVQNICHILTDDVSLPAALETIDHVYTLTSLSGFEALMRGIKVTVLGCPFYAGWGLTDDRQPNIRRKRNLTVDELFTIAYCIYPQYYHPVTGVRTDLETVLNYIITSKSAEV